MADDMAADIAKLTVADFEQHLEGEFRIPLPDGEVELKLVGVHRLGAALREGGAFALTFLTPFDKTLPQAIYPLKNAALGTLELFLVPHGPQQGGHSYEAVFT